MGLGLAGFALYSDSEQGLRDSGTRDRTMNPQQTESDALLARVLAEQEVSRVRAAEADARRRSWEQYETDRHYRYGAWRPYSPVVVYKHDPCLDYWFMGCFFFWIIALFVVIIVLAVYTLSLIHI